MHEAGAQVPLGPLQRSHVVHRHHERGGAAQRGAVERQRVVHVRRQPAQRTRQEKLLGRLDRPGRQGWPAQVREPEQGELAAALGGHVGERAQQALRVAPDPLLAQVLDVERAGVDADLHGRARLDS